MRDPGLVRALAAEALGSTLLLAVVVGSGIMGERLSGGNDAIALLGNTLSTGAGLVVLIHGWPDDALTWNRVTPALVAAGYRVIMPWLRGAGTTRFLDAATPRSGQLVALGQDLVELPASRLVAVHQQPGLAAHLAVEILHPQFLAALRPGRELIARAEETVVLTGLDRHGQGIGQGQQMGLDRKSVV
mgnify:CR=1 FL=1